MGQLKPQKGKSKIQHSSFLSFIIIQTRIIEYLLIQKTIFGQNWSIESKSDIYIILNI